MNKSGTAGSTPVTLSSHVLGDQRQHPAARGDLTLLLMAVQTACKVVAAHVRRAGLLDVIGKTGARNVQGEEVQKLDAIAHECFVEVLRATGRVRLVVSEEAPDAIFVGGEDAPYAVVFDPLDGSSNIDSGISVGSIFGVFRAGPGSGTEAVLRPGREMVAAGYALYGSCTMVVLAVSGGSAHGYTLDPAVGEFVLTHPALAIPARGTTYSVNEARADEWSPATAAFVRSLRAGRSSRYVGSMVADVHRTLLHGGVFLYPAGASAPGGKLRLLYECAPLALVVEAAGGRATTGTCDVLDAVPAELHARTPVVLGSAQDVGAYLAAVRSSAPCAADSRGRI